MVYSLKNKDIIPGSLHKFHLYALNLLQIVLLENFWSEARPFLKVFQFVEDNKNFASPCNFVYLFFVIITAFPIHQQQQKPLIIAASPMHQHWQQQWKPLTKGGCIIAVYIFSRMCSRFILFAVILLYVSRQSQPPIS